MSDTPPHTPYAQVSVDALMPEYWSEFTYVVPEGLRDALGVGQLVWVPLRDKLALGVVLDFAASPPTGVSPSVMKPVHACVEPTFRLTAIQLNLAVWMSERYCCSVYHAATPMLPPGVGRRTVEVYALTPAGRAAGLPPLTKLQRQVIERLVPCDDDAGLTLEELRAALGGALTSVLDTLQKRGLVQKTVRVKHDPPPATKPVAFVRAIPDEEREVPLNAPRQQQALDYLRVVARRTSNVESEIPPGFPSGNAGDGQEYSPSTFDPRLSTAALPPGATTVAAFRKATGIGLPILHALANRGLVELGALAGDAPRERVVEIAPAPSLTPQQAAVWEPIRASLDARDGATYLLHGVTGSGKTEVYLRAVAASLRAGRGAVLCVPEIALSAQMVGRVQARFPGQVAVLHSNLTDNQRYAAWRRLARGEAMIAVGPRSALFAPIPDLGCIVVDEEHDAAYKQGSNEFRVTMPRYHSREVARTLAQLSGAVCILGSATPDLGTYGAARRGDFGYLAMTERVMQQLAVESLDGPVPVVCDAADGQGHPLSTLDSRPSTGLPPVSLVDMREERKLGNMGVFSHALRQLLATTHAKGEQSIVLLNRRGMATFTECRSCGQVVQCPRCDVPLVYHADTRLMRCHRCDYQARPRQTCAACGSHEVRAYGVGTERVEEEVRTLLPTARVTRWDADSLSREGGHENILRRLEAHEVDVLVGTQMVAKGLDLPKVTAIGVVNGDQHLHLPDYRAAERTFQLLTQVAGRAGRRIPGRVIIQTTNPDHPALAAARTHDYAAFAAGELAERERLGHPPFRKLARFVYRHKNEDRAREEADRLAFALARAAYRDGYDDFMVIGPAPCFAAKIRHDYYWHVVASGSDLTPILRNFPIPYGWIVDVDPVSLL